MQRYTIFNFNFMYQLKILKKGFMTYVQEEAESGAGAVTPITAPAPQH